MSILSRLIITGLCLACAHAMTQETENAPAESGKWYQVHLAVFEHRSGAGEFEEQWRSQLQLTYPDELVRLKTRERYLTDLCGTPPEASDAQNENKNRLVAILEQVDGEDGDALSTDYHSAAADPTHPDCRKVRPDLFPEDESAAANARAEAVVAEAASLVGGAASESTDEDPEPFEPPTPFILEDSTDEEFAEVVKKLRGAYRYRILFAGSWPQPLKARDAAPALLIQGGKEVGKHFQLEGYIKVALERYLHIDTDLWLSDFAELPQWAREQQSRQLRIDDAAALTRQDPAAQDSTAQESGAGDRSGVVDPAPNRLSEFPTLPLPFPVNDPSHRLPERRHKPATAGSGSKNAADLGQTGDRQWSGRARDLPSRPSSNLDLLGAEDSSYYVKHTVVMRQNRRMRSGELHYIDHPMFGLVVKITPLPAPEEDADSPSP